MTIEGISKIKILESETYEITSEKGRVSMVEGPCTLTVVRSKIHRIRKFITISSSNIIVVYTDGKYFNIHAAVASKDERQASHIFLHDGEFSHGVRCNESLLNIEPGGPVELTIERDRPLIHMKNDDGRYSKYSSLEERELQNRKRRHDCSDSLTEPQAIFERLAITPTSVCDIISDASESTKNQIFNSYHDTTDTNRNSSVGKELFKTPLKQKNEKKSGNIVDEKIYFPLNIKKPRFSRSEASITLKKNLEINSVIEKEKESIHENDP